MRVVILGSGGALTSARRGNTAILVEGDRHLLIDCPADPPRAMKEAGGDWTAVDDVILTHRHPDHVLGVVSLVLQRYITPRPDGWAALRLYGPSSALAVARTLLETVDLFERDDLFPIELNPLSETEESFDVGDLMVKTAPVDHGSTATLAVKVTPRTDDGSRAVVHSADTAPCEAVFEMSRGAALLLHECSVLDGDPLPSHTALSQVNDIVAATDAAQIVLVHLPPMEARAEGRIRRDLAKRFGGRVRLGEDGMVFEL